MKTKTILLIMIVFLLLIGCKNDENKNDCGCDSENKTLVTNKTGTIQMDTEREIYYIYELQGAMTNTYEICNKESISGIPLGSNVIYSGYAKELCDNSQFGTGMQFVGYVTITEIHVNQ